MHGVRKGDMLYLTVGGAQDCDLEAGVGYIIIDIDDEDDLMPYLVIGGDIAHKLWIYAHSVDYIEPPHSLLGSIYKEF